MNLPSWDLHSSQVQPFFGWTFQDVDSGGSSSSSRRRRRRSSSSSSSRKRRRRSVEVCSLTTWLSFKQKSWKVVFWALPPFQKDTESNPPIRRHMPIKIPGTKSQTVSSVKSAIFYVPQTGRFKEYWNKWNLEIIGKSDGFLSVWSHGTPEFT